MRILIVSERFHPEEFIINDLAAEWVRRGFDVHVLTQAPSYPGGTVYPGHRNRLYARSTWNGVTIHRIPTVQGYHRRLLWKVLNYLNFAATGSLAALFVGRGFDRALVYQTGPLTLAIPAWVLRRAYGLRMSIWTQDVWPDTVYAYGFKKTWLMRAFLDCLVRTIYSACDTIFVSCEGFADKLKPYAGGRPIVYAPNWPMVDASAPAGAPARLGAGFNFTFAGNTGRVQNLDRLARGFGLYRSRGGAAQLNIVGDGSYLAELKALVARERIPGVVFWGRKPSSAMPPILAASDVLVISLTDHPVFALTVPSKFQSYLTARKPIYCVLQGEVRRLVEKHSLGLCAEPADVEQIASGFDRFSRLPPAELAAYGERAGRLLAAGYDRARIMERITAHLLPTSPA